MPPLTPTDLALAAAIALLIGIVIGMGVMVLTDRKVMRS